jgi:hypothetical protein
LLLRSLPWQESCRRCLCVFVRRFNWSSEDRRSFIPCWFVVKILCKHKSYLYADIIALQIGTYLLQGIKLTLHYCFLSLIYRWWREKKFVSYSTSQDSIFGLISLFCLPPHWQNRWILLLQYLSLAIHDDFTWQSCANVSCKRKYFEYGYKHIVLWWNSCSTWSLSVLVLPKETVYIFCLIFNHLGKWRRVACTRFVQSEKCRQDSERNWRDKGSTIPYAYQSRIIGMCLFNLSCMLLRFLIWPKYWWSSQKSNLNQKKWWITVTDKSLLGPQRTQETLLWLLLKAMLWQEIGLNAEMVYTP